jgi:GH15 family glucan-1,4-alpha-glucosidase
MYNMEWVRDDMMVMIGLLHAGFIEEARTILLKTLDRSVGPDGCTIESSRWSGYDLTELDQNGELLYGVWSYYCWTGDAALVRKYWKKITLAADYPLQPVFWDQKSGLLRNMREYWERGGATFGIEDGFELSYQFWMILGLEKAAALAEVVKASAARGRWIAAAEKIRHAMLEDPVYRMIEQGALIKRRTRDGRWQQFMIPVNRAALPPGSPLATVEKPECDPDTASALPIVFGMVDPGSPLATTTLASIERLWNQQWTHGGYSRYNTTSEPDPPAPWAFATLFMARAYAETGNDEKVWRALRWLHDIHGGKAGAWFERYGPSITPPAPPVCIVGWTWAEFSLLFVHHFAGFRPETDRLVIRPRPLKGIATLRTTQTVRGATIDLTVRTGQPSPGATVNGKIVAMNEGRIEIPYPRKGSHTHIVIHRS